MGAGEPFGGATLTTMGRLVNLGQFRIDDTLTFYEGIGDTEPTYRVYEEITDTPLLTGTMSGMDMGGVTLFYQGQLALTAANGFEVGKCYCIRVVLSVSGADVIDLQTFQMANLIVAFVRSV